jgi:threonine synthase
MKFASTRGSAHRAGLAEAISGGFAPDGGAWQPLEDSSLRHLFLLMSRDIPYPELLARIAGSIADLPLTPGVLSRSSALQPTLGELEDGIALMDLTGGPSGSFRDYGSAFIADVLSLVAARGDRPVTAIVASTGDSASAAAWHLSGVPGLRLAILFPDGPVRGVPRGAVESGAVLPVRVRGGYAECQALVRHAFSDQALVARLGLVPVNSINVGRLVAQAMPFVYAFSRLRPEAGDFFFSIPAMNAGNLIAGLYAWKWGLPITGFVSPVREGDLIVTCLASSCSPSDKDALRKFLSEFGNPENAERLNALIAGAPGLMRALLHPVELEESEERRAARELWEASRIHLGPYGISSYAAARRLKGRLIELGGKIVCVSLNHPSRYAERIREWTGSAPEVPERLAWILKEVEAPCIIDADIGALAAVLDGFVGGGAG